MCGITGIVARQDFSVRQSLLGKLRRLEYRGYDSCGFATSQGVRKREIGYIQNLIGSTGQIMARAAIAHTRWATHGKVTEQNTHPHINGKGDIFIVHNGIIENYQELRKKLEAQGYEFTTQTDTEVIPHFFDYMLNDKKHDMHKAISEFLNKARGTFAILLMRKGDDRIYAIKRDSPLVLGICKDCSVLASDIYAFSDETDKAIFFDDDEYAIVSPDGYRFYDCFGDEINKRIRQFEWARQEETKENFEHFMLKEIHEQPHVSERLIRSFENIQKEKLAEFARLIKEANRVVFLACGTSYHAALVGSYLLTQLGIRAHAVIASEFENFLLVDKKTLVIPVSQSGETMDVVTVLKDIKLKKAKIASIVNVPYSTVQRLSNVSLEVLAGQEVCVAATKSFTNQLVCLFAIARELGLSSISLNAIPDRIAATIEKNDKIVRKLAKELSQKNDIFVLGRGISYPVAREIALKLKEIPYQHAEGMMAGELKHGTIALIEEGTPVISLIPNNSHDMISSTQEVEARGARTIIISNTEGEIHIPKCSDAEFAVYASLIGHLLSYYIAKDRGLPIDKPRNLAKSVTVK